MTKAPPPIFGTCDTKQELEEGTTFAPRFDKAGLIPVVTTDAGSGELLMHAYMNAEALAKSIETGDATYWSRSRGELWRKGETSGQVQKIVEMRTDCDQDTIWLKVNVTGNGASCHVGYRACFYRAVPVGGGEAGPLSLTFTEQEKAYDPATVYGEKPEKGHN